MGAILTSRRCISCETSFQPIDGEQWWCGDDCRATLEHVAELRRQDYAEASRNERESVEVSPDFRTEAEAARAALKTSSPAADRLPKIDLDVVRTRAQVDEALHNVLVLVRLARRSSDIRDADMLLNFAQSFLDRAAAQAHGVAEELHGPDHAEDADGDRDVPTFDDVPEGAAR